MKPLQFDGMVMEALEHPLWLGLSLIIGLAGGGPAQALTQDGSDGKPSSLFISVLDPDTKTSYYRDLNINHREFLANPAAALDLSGDSQLAPFLGKTSIVYNIAAFERLAADNANLASWGYLLTSTGARTGFAGDFVSIDAVRQRMQIYAAYLTGSSGLAKPGDGGYFDGDKWGSTLGGAVGGNTAGLPGQELPFFFVNNRTGDAAGAQVERLGHWLLSKEGKLTFIRTVSTNLPPQAVAISPLAPAIGDTVLLDGSGSTDPVQGPEPLRYAWNRMSGPFVTLTDSQSAKASFIPAAAGTYVFRLTVGDGEASATATTQVAVGVVVNQPPMAEIAVNPSVRVGDKVILDGNKSRDPDNYPKPLSYRWSQVSGPANPALTGVDTVQAAFTPTQAGSYQFALEVSDGALTARAQADVVVTPSTIIALNAPANWKVGTRQRIAWVTRDVSPKQPVRIQFAKDGLKFKTLASTTVKKAFFNWKPANSQYTDNGTLRACVRPQGKTVWACDGLKVKVQR